VTTPPLSERPAPAAPPPPAPAAPRQPDTSPKPVPGNTSSALLARKREREKKD
jgi:hypothetical protein